MADLNQFITVMALRDIKAWEFVTTKDVGPRVAIGKTIRAPVDRIIERIETEATRVHCKVGSRPTDVILGTSEWVALEEWFRGANRYFGLDADGLEAHAENLLGMRPVVDPTTESRITPVFGPRETFWRLGDVAR